MNISNKQLAALLQEAFVDGFQCGESHECTPYKYPPIGLAWLSSDTRSTVAQFLGDVDYEPLTRWHEAKYGEGVDVPLETLEPIAIIKEDES